MSRFVKLSLLALTCMALLATKAMADELEDVSGEVPLPTAEVTKVSTPTGLPAVELSFSNYKTEAALLAVVAGLVANYLYGSRRNQAASKTWEKPITDVLRQNFSLVGDGKQVLEWDSAADLLFYASGRRHCKFVQGHVQLRARQDLVSLANDLMVNNEEKVEIEVTLNDDVPGFVFAAVPRKRSKGVCRDRYDVGTFAKIINNDKVSSKVAIISEIADATQQLLASGLEDELADESSLISEVFVSDCPDTKPDTHEFKREKKLMVSVLLPAPTAAGIAQLKKALEFVFYLVDYLGESMALRPETQRKLTKARDEAFKEFAKMAEQERQEALAKTLAEKRKNELEDVERMTPEQRRKWEEKDRKKQLKKEQSRRTRRIK